MKKTQKEKYENLVHEELKEIIKRNEVISLLYYLMGYNNLSYKKFYKTIMSYKNCFYKDGE